MIHEIWQTKLTYMTLKSIKHKNVFSTIAKFNTDLLHFFKGINCGKKSDNCVVYEECCRGDSTQLGITTKPHPPLLDSFFEIFFSALDNAVKFYVNSMSIIVDDALNCNPVSFPKTSSMSCDLLVHTF